MPTDRRDPLELAADAPLFAAYLRALDRRRPGEHPMMTPGHKGRTHLTGAAVDGDAALSGGVDTVKLQHGYLPEAERRAAALWGGEFCRFSVGGSTHGNQTLALAAAHPGDEVVVSRTLHRSMLLGLVLAGLRPVWVHPRIDPTTGLPAGVDAATVQAALRAHPAAAAVLVGDPSYVGTHSDIAALADAAHGAGVPLVVDAAWAAHFGFHPDLPPHALAAGADALVTSAHKVLPSYSQAAIVLARTQRLDGDRLGRAFEATYTTSPAGQILASIDASRALLERDGEKLAGQMLDSVAAARRRLADVPGLDVLEGPGVDPAKLVVVLAGTGAHGVAVEGDLVAAGCPVEMADRDTITALVTMADSPGDVEAFTDTLARLVERHRGEPRPVAPAASWTVEAETVVTPREAFFADSERVPIATAVGRVSAELVAPYPPGIPVLAPGELVTAGAVDALTEAAADGIRIAYAADPTLRTLDVLRR
ncbi:MAG: aminotransferase class I/II-fold pyridoxal phosphate-dependent enzyme [Acidimicrobiales bacterium]